MASALRAFAVECGALAACLVVYLGALAAIAVAAALFVTHWNFDDGLAQLHLDAVLGVAEPRQGWRPDPDAPPAFAVSQFDIAGITATYEVARDGGDGRRDILRWTHGATPVAGVRIDRPGPETPPAATMATFAEAGFHPELPLGEAAAAGVIESKFGPVKLFDLVDRSGAAMSCLGFVRTFAGPSLRLKGWSCQGETPAARRAAVVCLLNRLVLLKAGHDARLAELFARAELRRTDCGGAAPRVAGDWIVSARDPRLRGAL